MTGFNLLDIVFAVLLCVFIFRGIRNGIIKEVGMIAALVLGLLCAYLFFQPVAQCCAPIFFFSRWRSCSFHGD